MSYSGIEQLVARLVHAQEVDGASPSPATKPPAFNFRSYLACGCRGLSGRKGDKEEPAFFGVCTTTFPRNIGL